jgi:transcriptional regulator with XRE-family HTH domain
MTDDRRTVLLALAQRGWTVYDLAQAARCSVAALRPWLAGTGAISQADRERIMAAIEQPPPGEQP